jgi:hypothetical protein
VCLLASIGHHVDVRWCSPRARLYRVGWAVGRCIVWVGQGPLPTQPCAHHTLCDCTCVVFRSPIDCQGRYKVVEQVTGVMGGSVYNESDTSLPQDGYVSSEGVFVVRRAGPQAHSRPPSGP